MSENKNLPDNVDNISTELSGISADKILDGSVTFAELYAIFKKPEIWPAIAVVILAEACKKPVLKVVNDIMDMLIVNRLDFMNKKSKLKYRLKLEEEEMEAMHQKGKRGNNLLVPVDEMPIDNPEITALFNQRLLSYQNLKYLILAKALKIPEKNLQIPDSNLLSKLLAHTDECCDDELIRWLYSSLFAAALNKANNDKVHAAFTSIISEMNPHDAKLLYDLDIQGPLADYVCTNSKTLGKRRECLYEDVYLKDCEYHYDFSDTLSLLNLERMNLIRIDKGTKLMNPGIDDKFNKNEIYDRAQKDKNKYGEGSNIEIDTFVYRFTPFGVEFRNICLDKMEQG